MVTVSLPHHTKLFEEKNIEWRFTPFFVKNFMPGSDSGNSYSCLNRDNIVSVYLYLYMYMYIARDILKKA